MTVVEMLSTKQEKEVIISSISKQLLMNKCKAVAQWEF